MADRQLAMGPYVVRLQPFWTAHELIETPPSFRLALTAEKWAAGIWIEIGGWAHGHASVLDSADSRPWRGAAAFTWQRSTSKEHESYAARWSDDLIAFHITLFSEDTTEDERESVRMLMSAMAGGAIVRRGRPPATHDPAPAPARPWWRFW